MAKRTRPIPGQMNLLFPGYADEKDAPEEQLSADEMELKEAIESELKSGHLGRFLNYVAQRGTFEQQVRAQWIIVHLRALTHLQIAMEIWELNIHSDQVSESFSILLKKIGSPTRRIVDKIINL